MQIDRRLYRNASGDICEEVAPGEAATLVVAKGQSLPDHLCRQMGILQYLERLSAPAVKAVHQAEVEDKAVHQEETEDKGLPYRVTRRDA